MQVNIECDMGKYDNKATKYLIVLLKHKKFKIRLSSKRLVIKDLLIQMAILLPIIKGLDTLTIIIF